MKTANYLFVICILLVLLCGGCAEQTQQQKVYRVGVLSGSNAFVIIADGFKGKMAELGYIEGKNIVYDIQKLNADPAGYDRVTKQFVEDGVDLIFAFPTEPALSAKAATQGTNIPVVFAHAGLEGSNLVKSVREPEGNLSGVRWPGPDLVVKRFEFLLELVPNLKRLYVPYDKNYPLVPPAIAALRQAAASEGVVLIELPATTLEDLKADLDARKKDDDRGMDAILLLPELIMQSPQGWEIISNFSKEYKLPLVGSSDVTIKTGSVFTYNVDPLEDGKLGAIITDKIFKGTPAADIPILTPETHLKINYKVARELGLNVSEGLLSRASEIIR